jgi:zinc protease
MALMHRRLPVRLVVTLCAFLALGSGLVRAESKLRFDYRDITLDNGLRVVTLEDHSCPVVAVHVWYHVGSKDERAERQGFAHMFEHMMFRGTDRLGPKDHFDNIRRTGGSSNAYTSFDQTVYVQTLPANQLELALWLEAERMGFLKIDQNSFDTERKVVEEERRLGLNRPYGTLAEKLVAELFKSHPYAWTPIGKIAHLRASAAQELRDFWMRYYVPNNATLVIVGDIKHAEAQRLAKRYFGWMPHEADPPRVTVHEPMPTKARAVSLREDNAPAPVVGIVWRTVPSRDDDTVPLDLLTTILGGGDSSRLYRYLVADKQLAVIAMAGTFSLEQEGFAGAAAVLTPVGGSTQKVLEAINAQIDKLRKEPVTARELLKAKNQMLAGLVAGNQTVMSKATLLGTAAVIEGDLGRVNRRLEQVRRVTADDLLRVARKYLAPEHSLTITVERNLLGTIFGGKSSELKNEENAPITAKPEKTAPPPGKPGLRRPADFPAKPPVARSLDSRFTMPHTRHVLPNGLKIIVVPNHEVPHVTIDLNLLAGAWTESKPGTASMSLGMLTKGTAGHTERELAEELETYAINLGGSGGMDTASVIGGCMTEHLERAMNLMAETVLTPTFPPKEFDKLRKQVRTGLAMSAAEPSYKASRELRRQLYGKHPYARTATGEIEDVDALQVKDLAGWWKKFARPDQATLIFAGDIDDAQAMRLAETAFGNWKAEGAKPEVKLPELPKPGPTRIYLVDHAGVQSQIRVGQLGIKRDHPDYPAAEVVSDYFGGAFSSRLMEVIRVQKGLTYGAGGGYRPSRFAGTFSINTFSKTESTAAAVRAVLDKVERLRKEPPTDKELRDTKSYYLGSFAGDHETPQQVAGELALLDANGLADDYFERLLEYVSRTDAAACMKLVRETLDPAKLVIVVVGNAGRIQKDLEKIAPVTLVRPGMPAAGSAERTEKTPAAPARAEPAQVVAALVKAINEGSGKELHPLFTKARQAEMPLPLLGMVLRQTKLKYGKINGVTTEAKPDGKYHVFRVRGEKQPLVLKVSLDDHGLLADLQLVPALLQDLPPGPLTLDQVQTRMQSAVAQTLDVYRVPSISLALVKGDRIVWTQAFGYQNVAKRVPADPETVYVTGSIFKVIVATAIMQQVDEGKLELDAPVNKYLKGFQVPNSFEKDAPLTVRHLLSHHGGVPNGAQLVELWDRRLPASVEDVVRKQVKVVSKPGTKFEYSNLAYTLAGYLVGQVDGTTFERAMARRLFTPLDMKRTAFTPTAAMIEDLAIPYQNSSNGKEVLPTGRVRLDVYPAGDVYSTPSDLARFLILHINGGKYGDKQIVSPKSIAEMAKLQFAKKDAHAGEGLGWMIRPAGQGRHMWHNGAVPGFYSFMMIDPDKRVGAVLFANKFNSLEMALGVFLDPLQDLSALAVELLGRMDVPRTAAAGHPGS